MMTDCSRARVSPPTLLLLVVAHCFVVVVVACSEPSTGTLTGNPLVLPHIDPTRVSVAVATSGPGNLEVRGATGAALPAEEPLEVVNLDRADEAQRVIVGAQGSFTVTLGGAPGDRIRLQLRGAFDSSAARYLRLDPATLETATVDMLLDSCLVLSDDSGAYVRDDVSVLVAGEPQTVRAEHRCSGMGAVVISEASLRSGSEGHRVDPVGELPRTIAEGESVDLLRVSIADGTRGPGFVFLDLEGATEGRRVIALRSGWAE